MAHEATPMLEATPTPWAQRRIVTLIISLVLKSGLSVAGPRAHVGGFPCPLDPHPNPSLGFPVAGTQGSALESRFGRDI